jgi:hypothetical protein
VTISPEMSPKQVSGEAQPWRIVMLWRKLAEITSDPLRSGVTGSAQGLSTNKTRTHDNVPTSVPSPSEFRVLWDGSSGSMLYVQPT